MGSLPPSWPYCLPCFAAREPKPKAFAKAAESFDEALSGRGECAVAGAAMGATGGGVVGGPLWALDEEAGRDREGLSQCFRERCGLVVCGVALSRTPFIKGESDSDQTTSNCRH